MPTVFNRKGPVYPPADAVYVGRPSKFGNPFVIGKDGTREEVLAKFERWFFADLPEAEALREEAMAELTGKDLVCWCAPERCHADLINEWLTGTPAPGPEVRILVCGSRNWGVPKTDVEGHSTQDQIADAELAVKMLVDMLDEFVRDECGNRQVVVISGMAEGADHWGARWAFERDHELLEFPADWTPGPLTKVTRRGKHGLYDPQAGHRRNQQMLDEGKPDVVIAFYLGEQPTPGTASMIAKSKAAGVRVIPHSLTYH